jgi:hypothetical protein
MTLKSLSIVCYAKQSKGDDHGMASMVKCVFFAVGCVDFVLKILNIFVAE